MSQNTEEANSDTVWKQEPKKTKIDRQLFEAIGIRMKLSVLEETITCIQEKMDPLDVQPQRRFILPIFSTYSYAVVYCNIPHKTSAYQESDETNFEVGLIIPTEMHFEDKNSTNSEFYTQQIDTPSGHTYQSNLIYFPQSDRSVCKRSNTYTNGDEFVLYDHSTTDIDTVLKNFYGVFIPDTFLWESLTDPYQTELFADVI